MSVDVEAGAVVVVDVAVVAVDSQEQAELYLTIEVPQADVARAGKPVVAVYISYV